MQKISRQQRQPGAQNGGGDGRHSSGDSPATALAASSRPAEARDILVGLDDLGVRRGGRWLVRGVTFDIRRGEIVTLIGPNGSGKSTTARAVVGVLRPDEGTVARAAGVSVGYVPQRLAIDRTLPLTVSRLMTLTATHTPAEIAAALEEVGIGHLAKAQVQSLSGGEFQRALLARAMLRRPDLLDGRELDRRDRELLADFQAEWAAGQGGAVDPPEKSG